MKNLSCCDIAGGVDKYCTYKQEQQTYKYIKNPEHCFACILTNHFRHLSSAISGTNHTCKIIMDCTTYYITDRNSNKCNRSKQNTLNRSKNRSCTCDIKQVNQCILPCRHRHIVYTILFCIGRCFSVVRLENMVT